MFLFSFMFVGKEADWLSHCGANIQMRYVMILAFIFTNLDMKMSEAKTARFISPPGIPNKNGVRDQTVSNTSLYLESNHFIACFSTSHYFLIRNRQWRTTVVVLLSASNSFDLIFQSV